MKDQLKHIDMESNNIRTLRDTYIYDFLTMNPILERMNLSNNHLNDEDAAMFTRALTQNTNLVQLNLLGGDDITTAGWTALRNSIFDPTTSFKSRVDANHKYNIEGLSFDPVYNNE